LALLPGGAARPALKVIGHTGWQDVIVSHSNTIAHLILLGFASWGCGKACSKCHRTHRLARRQRVPHSNTIAHLILLGFASRGCGKACLEQGCTYAAPHIKALVQGVQAQQTQQAEDLCASCEENKNACTGSTVTACGTSVCILWCVGR